MFWLTLGATAGMLAMRRLSRAVAAVTPSGLADSAANVGTTIRAFREEVRVGMAERELELRDALGLNDTLDDRPADAGEARRERPIQHEYLQQMFGDH
jgi:hypothetical protein